MVKLLAVLMYVGSLSAVIFADDHSGDTSLSDEWHILYHVNVLNFRTNYSIEF